jgi:tetratricopeptide (TPR) repeat protein
MGQNEVTDHPWFGHVPLDYNWEMNMCRRAAAAAIVASATCLCSTRIYSQAQAEAALAAPAVPPVKIGLARGYNLKSQKRSAEAISAFEEVLKEDSGNHPALTELGYLHTSFKHYDLAVKYLSAASAQDPGDMQIHMGLAYAYHALKQEGSAEEQFKIVAASPGVYQAKAQNALNSPLREKGYASLKSGNRAAARKAFETAIAKAPKDADALKQLGFINHDDGDLTASAANFEAVRALEPNDYSVALQLGYTYTLLRKEDQARKQFEAALSSTDEKIHAAAAASLQSTGGASASVENVAPLHAEP